MRKNKKILRICVPMFGIIFLFVVFAISNNYNNGKKEPFDYLADYEGKSNYSVKVSMSYEYSSPTDLYNESEYVAIVKIESIDGVNNYSSIYDNEVYPYTYGKMRILRVLKGNLDLDSVVNFYRLGGVISANKYYNNLRTSQKESLVALKDSTDELDFTFEDDIKIENNKIYLVYLNDEKYCEGKENSYAIHGLQIGLREVKNQQTSLKYSKEQAKDIMVLNNITGEYESLNEIIPQ